MEGGEGIWGWGSRRGKGEVLPSDRALLLDATTILGEQRCRWRRREQRWSKVP